MSPVNNARVIFSERPVGHDYPDPEKTLKYDDSETIDVDNVELASNDFLVKVLVLAIDPYIRGRMFDSGTPHAYKLGETLNTYGIGHVVRSNNDDVKAGDHLYGFFSFQEYVINNNAKMFRVLDNPERLPWSIYVGICGMPGKTAYMGWKEHAKAKKGETVFVTTGGGPVGSLVIQLAKQDGLKVIAAAGSDDKVAFMRSIGADVAFNYKTSDMRQILKEHGPINIYWDHVGGESLENAIDAAAPHARFIECGMISQVSGPPYTVKNLFFIIPKCISLIGFTVGTLEPKYDEEFYKVVPAKVKSGEIKYTEERNKGLQATGQALYNVLTGANTAKSVIVVAEQ